VESTFRLEVLCVLFSADPNVPDVPVTLVRHGVRFDNAVRLVIREARKRVPGLVFGRG
jgi:hypothetical protein